MGQISLQTHESRKPATADRRIGADRFCLQSLLQAQSLSLLSYSSIDVYGTGQVGSAGLANLALNAGEIRGFNNSGGEVTFAAQNIQLGNNGQGLAPGAVATSAGTLTFNAQGGAIDLGNNQIAIDQYATLNLTASGGVLAQGSSGKLAAQADLVISTPLITGAAGANETISASGALTIQGIAGGSATVTGGLAPTLALQGRQCD